MSELEELQQYNNNANNAKYSFPDRSIMAKASFTQAELDKMPAEFRHVQQARLNNNTLERMIRIEKKPLRDIRYSQSSITPYFHHNSERYPVRKAIADIKNAVKLKTSCIDDKSKIPTIIDEVASEVLAGFEPIRVILLCNKWVSLDNRRLYIFNQAFEYKEVNINVVICDLSDTLPMSPGKTIEDELRCKYTTQDDTKISVYNFNYKTAICNHWQRGLHCPYGDRCNFAHGPEQQVLADEEAQDIEVLADEEAQMTYDEYIKKNEQKKPDPVILEARKAEAIDMKGLTVLIRPQQHFLELL
jgi:hypothetical protein